MKRLVDVVYAAMIAHSIKTDRATCEHAINHCLGSGMAEKKLSPKLARSELRQYLGQAAKLKCSWSWERN